MKRPTDAQLDRLHSALVEPEDNSPPDWSRRAVIAIGVLATAFFFYAAFIVWHILAFPIEHRP